MDKGKYVFKHTECLLYTLKIRVIKVITGQLKDIFKTTYFN